LLLDGAAEMAEHGRMPLPPAKALFFPRARPSQPPKSRPIQEFTVAELKDELLRRGNVDFSRFEVLIKLSPFLLLFAMGLIWKLSVLMDGTMLACILQ
jgi:hypothetical protein